MHLERSYGKRYRVNVRVRDHARTIQDAAGKSEQRKVLCWHQISLVEYQPDMMNNAVFMTAAKQANRLAEETSPYLLQHAGNPVDWHPWDETALNKARREDKPILLSIGYSACHWCHVMEHESFEDEKVADFLNRHFICIKVDREERPDLDKIYQTAHHLLTQRPGGWPLNVVLTPDGHAPFFAGTYFPGEPRHGLPSFLQVMEKVRAYYQEHRADMPQHTAAVKDAFQQLEPAAGSQPLSGDLIEQAISQLIGAYDPVNGGFGTAPKFPHPSNIALCLRYSKDPRAKYAQRALHVARHTLHAMAWGGLYDHLSGGFCRYSVDDKWMIPHFEKMLYDNAQLLPLYADIWRMTGDQEFLRTAEQTARWVIREMQASDGGYYSTLDADSEGEEGKFYVWSSDELKSLLTDREWSVFEVRFGLRGRPNFEGKWHLNVHAPLDLVAERCGQPAEQVGALLDSAREKLFTHRDSRVHPGRDEKILTAWNGMMISGMAHTGRLLGRPEFVESASRALDFVYKELWRAERLAATTKDGRTRLNGYLDDYAFVLDGVLGLLQARWRDKDIRFAIKLADSLLEHFEDKHTGGLYFTSDDHETLLHRTKPASDDSTPSGNAVAAFALWRLGHLLGEQRYLVAAEKTLRAMAASIARYPSGHCALLIALQEYLQPAETIVLRGSGPELVKWQAIAQDGYVPQRLVVAIPDDAVELPGILSNRSSQAAITAYVCAGFTCREPVTDIAAFRSQLGHADTDQLPE